MYRLERIDQLDVTACVGDPSGGYGVRSLGNWANGCVLYNGGNNIGDPAVVVKDIRLAEEIAAFLNGRK